jgi:hypothetical protein
MGRVRRLAVAVVPLVAAAVLTQGTSAGPAAAGAAWPETTGGVTHTWTNPANAGGVEGPVVAARSTVDIECKLQGFKVADGNTWWYRIASAPWSGQYYASADAFYNNGATSGSLAGTPWVDPAIADCSSTSGGSQSQPTVSLAQGPTAPFGYRYAITLAGFPASSTVRITCFDTVSAAGFYTFSLGTDASGRAFTQSYCYSADGPDHWVTANGVTSNHVSWGQSTGGGSTGGGSTGGSGTTNPPQPVDWKVKTDQLIFKSSMSVFIASRFVVGGKGELDWSTDNCSVGPIKEPVRSQPRGYDFRGPCWRHDFGYRNYKKQNRFTEDARQKIDDNFHKDMYAICDTFTGIRAARGVECRRIADAYYGVVRGCGANPAPACPERVWKASKSMLKIFALLGG